MKKSTLLKGAWAFVLVALGIWVAGATAAPESFRCTSYTSPLLGKDVDYCIDRATPETPAQPGEPVVYFMHGTHGGAGTWSKNNYKHSLAVLRNSGPMKSMTFVSFNTSAYSFFSDAPVPPGSKDTSQAYETWFVTEFIPYIEQTLNVCHERACRGIMGESMGGFGAIKTALRHPELFSAVAVNSPALSPFPEDRPFKDWVNYFATKPIGRFKGEMLTKIVFKLFPTPEIFDANNPTWLVQNYASEFPFPAIYFDMGGQDEYGFYDGYALFKAALDQRGCQYSTIFEEDGHHDMWKRHAADAITFEQDNVGQ